MTSLARHLAPSEWRAAGAEPSWLAETRQDAWQQLESDKLPTGRTEDWKYTSLELLAKRQFTTYSESPPAAWFDDQFSELTGRYRLVFVDGRYAEEFSRTAAVQDGLDIGPISEHWDAGCVETCIGNPEVTTGAGFALLATARFADGVFIDVADSCDAQGGIDIVYVCAGDTVAHQRNIIRLGSSACLTITEHYLSGAESAGLFNNHLAIELAPKAELGWVRIQREATSAFVVTNMQVQQRAGSKFTYFGMDTGGRLVRHDIHNRLLESGAEVRLSGITVIARQQHVDNHTDIEHMAPDCISRERFKAVAAGRSRVVFNGKIKVHPGADGTDSSQSNANLLLSQHAEIDTKPELEIYADDVIAAHGATVGQLDEKSVFYLRSRGLSELEARQLLIRGFCRELVDRVPAEDLREVLDGHLARALPEAGVV